VKNVPCENKGVTILELKEGKISSMSGFFKDTENENSVGEQCKKKIPSKEIPLKP